MAKSKTDVATSEKVYLIVIDKETGETKVEDIGVLYKIMKELLG